MKRNMESRRESDIHGTMGLEYRWRHELQVLITCHEYVLVSSNEEVQKVCVPHAVHRRDDQLTEFQFWVVPEYDACERLSICLRYCQDGFSVQYVGDYAESNTRTSQHRSPLAILIPHTF